MKKMIWLSLASALLLVGCSNGETGVELDESDLFKDETDVSAETGDEEDEMELVEYEEIEEDDESDGFFRGTPEFDEEFYLLIDDSELLPKEEVEPFAGLYADRRDMGEGKMQQTIAHIRPDGKFTFYHFNVFEPGEELNEEHEASGYYLDNNMDIQRRTQSIIPDTNPVRIQTGYITMEYGEYRLVNHTDLRIIPTLNADGQYVFGSKENYKVYSNTMQNYEKDDYLGDSFTADGDVLDYGVGNPKTRTTTETITTMFTFDTLRSAPLVASDIADETADAKATFADTGHDYYESPQAFDVGEIDRLTVVKDTTEYSGYTKDNDLLEFDYVYIVEGPGNFSRDGIYGYKDHYLWKLDDNERWQQY